MPIKMQVGEVRKDSAEHISEEFFGKLCAPQTRQVFPGYANEEQMLTYILFL